MKHFYLRYFYLLFTIYCLLISCTSVTPYYRYQANIRGIIEPPDIQVLLTNSRNSDEIEITLKGGYQVFAYSPNRARHFISGRMLAEGDGFNKVAIKASDGGVKIGEMNLNTADVVIKPIQSNTLIKINSNGVIRSYRGVLRIKASSDNKLAASNVIDLESYLYSVVGSEMYSRYPTYALATQAVASRTFALFRIRQNHLSRSSNDGQQTTNNLSDFDLTDDVYSQVYKGEEQVDKKTIEAVDKTRGVVMEFNGRIFYSIFHDTCGGATEPGNLVFGLTSITPLNGRGCGYCYQSKYYKWCAVFTEEEIIQKLKLEGVSRIDAITSLQNGPGGHIISIGLKIPDRSADMIMDAQKFRIALDPNKLRSTKFDVTRKDKSFEFTGYGWGHAVGMCQEGANGMALKDFDTLQILEYYYPESRVVKIY